MSDPSWHMDHVLHLIELYEDNSVLWNHTMEEHKDLSAFEQAKQKIVEGLKKKGWHYTVHSQTRRQENQFTEK